MPIKLGRRKVARWMQSPSQARASAASLLLVFFFLFLALAACVRFASADWPTAPEGAAGVAGAAPLQVLLEDFEGPNPLSRWELGLSSPELTPTLSLGAGYEGLGGYLGYQLDMNEWVEARLSLGETVEAYGLALWLKSPAKASLQLIVVRENGIYDYHPLPRPFQARDGGAWYHQVVKFDGQVSISKVFIRCRPLQGSPQASGEIVLDNLFALLEPIVVSIDAAAPPISPPGPGPRTLRAFLGVDENQREGADEQMLAMAQAAGIGTVRTDALRWHALEVAPGVYDFAAGDSIVMAHQARGLRTILNIHGGSQFHTGAWNNPPLTELELDAFGDYVEAIAERYSGRAMIYDIWSEPENWIWNPPLQPDQFAAILRTAAGRIRAVDPTATVVSGGIVHYSTDYIQGIVAAGGLEDMDGFGVHSYNIGWPETLAEALLIVRSEIGALPVWDTEWGWPSAPFAGETLAQARQRQAMVVARQYLSAWASGLSAVTYWSFLDRGEDPYETGDTFGLVAYDYEAKPAYTATQTLSGMAAGRILVGVVDDTPAGVYGLRLDGRHDVLFVLWSTLGGSPLTVTMPLSATVRGFLGGTVTPVEIGQTQVLTLDAGTGPVYVTCHSCPTTLTPIYLPVVSRNL